MKSELLISSFFALAVSPSEKVKSSWLWVYPFSSLKPNLLISGSDESWSSITCTATNFNATPILLPTL